MRSCWLDSIGAIAAVSALLAIWPGSTQAQTTSSLSSTNDPRIRRVTYAPDKVIPVPARRGMVTQISLSDDETITTPPATGKGADCQRETDTWCVVAFGRDIFIKPKTGATRNNMLLVSSRRKYAFDLLVEPEGSMSQAVMRIDIEIPKPPAPIVATSAPEPAGPAPLTAQELIANRMHTMPNVRNSKYSVAVGTNSEDIVPVMVFDDGTHTYFSFPNNRPLPTVFDTTPDGNEEMVNASMDEESQLLVADRVSRRFVLRLGGSVANVINEAFDIDGVAPKGGTIVPRVARALRAEASASAGVQR